MNGASTSRSARFAAFVAGTLVLAAAARGEGAEDPRATEPAKRRDERSTRVQLGPSAVPPPPPETRIDDAAERSLQRALDRLAALAAESPDGSLPPHGLTEAEGRGFAPLAVDALAALAWMGGGSQPGRGPHGAALATVIDRLLDRCELDPNATTPGYLSQDGDALSRMHGHGFASLALSQAWTMSTHTERGARIAQSLSLSLRCIERAQGLEGGWFYEPRKSLEHEGSITITLVQALRGARDAGVGVDATTVGRAIEYVRRSQKEDGSFRYALGDPASSVALTAASVATLNAAGTYGGTEVEEGWAWLFRALEARSDPEAAFAPNPLEPSSWKKDTRRLYCRYYERLYVAQCLWQHADPKVFERWVRDETRSVLVTQRDDGSWHDAQFGDAYATAMNALFLEIPLGLLPIFQR
ncbi:MAG: hypothetical protein IPJ77_03335 [Planctomycetes bacterium]|nr:hypothetical protein [Planctomycetota bacterium]